MCVPKDQDRPAWMYGPQLSELLRGFRSLRDVPLGILERTMSDKDTPITSGLDGRPSR